MAYVDGVWKVEAVHVDSDRKMDPGERMEFIAAVGMGLSPMHPQMYADLRAEYDDAVAEVAAQN